MLDIGLLSFTRPNTGSHNSSKPSNFSS